MISGTDFQIESPEFVVRACHGLRAGVASASEIAELQAECEENRAMCLACEDGMAVVDARPGPEGLEMFIWLAVAFRHGAFTRQGPALEMIGRDLGAKTMAFVARRRGWARALGPEWRRRGSYEFVRSIN
jgi:hypothetical protein